jgi:hypothetical protein
LHEQRVAAAPDASCKQLAGACFGTFAPCCCGMMRPAIIHARPDRNKMGTECTKGGTGAGRRTSGVGNHAMPKEGWYKDDVASVCRNVYPWQVGVRIRGDVDPLVLFPSLYSMRRSQDSVRWQKAPSFLAPNYHTEDVLRRCAGCSQNTRTHV